MKAYHPKNMISGLYDFQVFKKNNPEEYELKYNRKPKEYESYDRISKILNQDMTSENIQDIRRFSNGILEDLGIKDLRIKLWPRYGLSLIVGENEVQEYIKAEEQSEKKPKSQPHKSSKTGKKIPSGKLILANRILLTRYEIEGILPKDFEKREFLDEDITNFLTTNEQPVFLLVAQPGKGKSTYAAHLVKNHPEYIYHFMSLEPLTGMGTGISDIRPVLPVNFVWSIGAQIICRFHEILDPVLQADLGLDVDKDQTVYVNNPQYSDLYDLLNLLVIRPLQSILRHKPDEKIVFVIDGLDESFSYGGSENITDLIPQISRFFPSVQFIITTRPNDYIYTYLNAEPLVFEEKYDEEDKVVIEKFIESKLNTPLISGLISSENLIKKSLIADIAEKSEDNFLYLHLFFKDLFETLEHENKTNLRNFISHIPTGLDNYYWHLLDQSLKKNHLQKTTDPWRRNYRPVLGILSAAQIPLSSAQIEQYIGGSSGTITVDDVLGDVHIFLSSNDSETGTTYGVYHRDFIDFLTDRKRCKKTYYVDIKDPHEKIARFFLEKSRHKDFELTSDSYFVNHIAFHLFHAEMNDELAEVISIEFLQKKMGIPNASISITEDLGFALDAALQKNDIAQMAKYLLIETSIKRKIREIDGFNLLEALGGKEKKVFKLLQEGSPSLKKAWCWAGLIPLITDKYPELLNIVKEKLVDFFESQDFSWNLEEICNLLFFTASQNLQIGLILADLLKKSNPSFLSSFGFNYLGSDLIIAFSTAIKQRCVESRLQQDEEKAIDEISNLPNAEGRWDSLRIATKYVMNHDVEKAYEVCQKIKCTVSLNEKDRQWKFFLEKFGDVDRKDPQKKEAENEYYELGSHYDKKEALVEVGQKAAVRNPLICMKILQDLQEMINEKKTAFDLSLSKPLVRMVQNLSNQHPEILCNEISSFPEGYVKDILTSRLPGNITENRSRLFSDNNTGYFEDKATLQALLPDIKEENIISGIIEPESIKTPHLQMFAEIINFFLHNDKHDEVYDKLQEEYSKNKTCEIIDPLFEGEMLFSLALLISKRSNDCKLLRSLFTQSYELLSISGLDNLEENYGFLGDFLLKIYSVRPELALSFFQSRIGPEKSPLIRNKNGSVRFVELFINACKSDTSRLHVMYGLLNEFAEFEKEDLIQKRWKFEVASSFLPEIFSQIQEVVHDYLQSRESFTQIGLNKSWFADEEEIDLLSHYIEQVILTKEERITEQLLDWLVDRPAGFSLGTIGYLRASKKLYVTNPFLAQVYVKRAIKLYKTGLNKATSDELAMIASYEKEAINRTLPFFFRDCPWTLNREIIEQIIEINDSPPEWAIHDLCQSFSKCDVELGVRYLSERGKELENPLEIVEEGLPCAISAAYCEQMPDDAEIGKWIHLIGISPVIKQRANLQEFFENSKNIFRMAFSLLAKNHSDCAIRLFQEGITSELGLDEKTAINDIFRGISRKDEAEAFLSILKEKEVRYDLPELLVLLIRLKLAGDDFFKEFLNEARNLFDAYGFEDAIEKGLFQSAVMYLESDSSDKELREVFHYALPQFKDVFPLLDKDRVDYKDIDQKFKCLLKYNLPAAIDFLSSIDKPEEQKRKAALLLKMTEEIHLSPGKFDLIFQVLDAQTAIAPETRDVLFSGLIRCADIEPHQKFQWTNRIQSSEERFSTQLELAREDVSVIDPLEEFLERVLDELGGWKNLEKSRMLGILATVVSGADEERAISFFTAAIECVTSAEKPNRPFDYRFWSIKQVILEWMNSSLEFDERLFNVLLEGALTFEHEK